MRYSPLENLPPEILHQICSLLYLSHKPSLASFSLTNSQSCHIASAWLFRHIRIRVRGSKTLRRDLETLLLDLQRRKAHDSILRITLWGHLKIYTEDEEESPISPWEIINGDYDEDYDEEIYDTLRHGRLYYAGQPGTAEELAPFWQTLVLIIEKSRQLQYLDYNCSNAVPLNIITALEQYRPSCRLHVEYFRFWNLSNETKIPDEIALAKSPNLYSLHTTYTWRDSNGVDDYNRNAVMDTIAGLAPNLKRVQMSEMYAASSPALSLRRSETKPAWKGFDKSLGSRHQASLERFSTNELLTRGRLEELTRIFDFANLQYLGVKHAMSNDALQHLTQRINFTKLRSLSIALARLTDGSSGIPDDGPYFEPATFLSSIPPLESLSLSGYITEILMDTMFTHHGRKLRTLKLDPNKDSYQRTGTYEPSCLGIAEYERLRDSCPCLEELQVPVQRSKSAGMEVRCYRILSQCKNLLTLFIDLKCDAPHALSTDPSFLWDIDENDEELMQYVFSSMTYRRTRAGHLRNAFINSAVDENLALSIWKLIADNKQGRPLHSLRLNSVGAMNFGPGYFSSEYLDIVTNLSKVWLLEKSVRDDGCGDAVQVRQVGKRAHEARIARAREHEATLNQIREEREEQERQSGNHHYRDDRTEPPELQVYRRIWPEQNPNGVDWRDDWSSFPLQVDGDSTETEEVT